MFLFFIIGGSN